MDIDAAIAIAISTFQTHTRDGDDVVFGAIVAQDVPEDLATRLVEFVPMAFTRHMLSREGPRFPDNYRRMHADGTTTEYKLLDQPIYRAAVHAAANAQGGDGYVAVAGRSADFHAINKALQNGSQLQNLVLSPTVLLDDDENADVANDRRWWQFWR